MHKAAARTMRAKHDTKSQGREVYYWVLPDAMALQWTAVAMGRVLGVIRIGSQQRGLGQLAYRLGRDDGTTGMGQAEGGTI